MRRFLVDTHAVLWWMADDVSLSPTARELIADPLNEPVVSAATVWEIAIKRSLGKLTVPDDLPERIVDQGFEPLAVETAHAWRVRALPGHHRDPFDRLLVAQALSEDLPIVTIDARLSEYGATCLW